MEENEIRELIDTFDGRSFSTYDFIGKLKSHFPLKWKDIVTEYGAGGKGSGKNFSSYSRVSQYLNKQFNNGNLEKLDYREAPTIWGSPVIRYWCFDKSAIGAQDFPDEISDPESVTEGAKISVTVNRYERSKAARYECIEKWGVKCFACGFDFEGTYGSIGAGFIHVHHLKPLSEIGGSYELDPRKDLRPLCPN